MELVVQNYSEAVTLRVYIFLTLTICYVLFTKYGPNRTTQNTLKTVLIGLLFFAPTTALFPLNEFFSSHPTEILWPSTLLPLISLSVIFTIIGQRSV